MGGAGLVLIPVFVLLFWPLGTIVRSERIRGWRKLGWILLWIAALLAGMMTSEGFFPPIVAQAPAHPGVAVLVLLGLMLLPVWLLYFCFRWRTRGLPKIPRPPLEQRVAYLAGTRLGASFARGGLVKAMVLSPLTYAAWLLLVLAALVATYLIDRFVFGFTVLMLGYVSLGIAALGLAVAVFASSLAIRWRLAILACVTLSGVSFFGAFAALYGLNWS